VCAVVTVTATVITCHTTKAPGGGQSVDPHAPTPASVVTLSELLGPTSVYVCSWSYLDAWFETGKETSRDRTAVTWNDDPPPPFIFLVLLVMS
jgi:hypothetical protein